MSQENPNLSPPLRGGFGWGLHLTQTSWDELLDTLQDILLQDEEKLENNISWYKKQFEAPNPDKQLLEKLYKRIQWDSHRLSNMSEIVNRLYTFNFVAIAESLQSAIKREEGIKGRKIPNWIFTLRNENDKITTYLQPL